MWIHLVPLVYKAPELKTKVFAQPKTYGIYLELEVSIRVGNSWKSAYSTWAYNSRC